MLTFSLHAQPQHKHWDVNRSINSGQNFNSEQSIHIFSSCAFQLCHWLFTNTQSRCPTAPFNCATVGVALITLLEHSDRAPDATKSKNLGFMQMRTLSLPTLQASSIRTISLVLGSLPRPATLFTRMSMRGPMSKGTENPVTSMRPANHSC